MLKKSSKSLQNGHLVGQDTPLADAFVILGLSSSETLDRSAFPQANILDSYPPVAHHLISDINLSYLCFPEGCKEIEISPTKGSFQGKHEFKHAIITNSTGIKRYVTSFLFYNVTVKNDPKTKQESVILVPSSFCLISQLPLFDLHKKWLVEIYKAYFARTKGEKKADTKEYAVEFYLSLLFHYLSYNIDLQNEVAIVYKDRTTPAKGLLRYRNYSEIGITLPNFTFQTLLESIEPIHIAYLIKLILLERKLIFIRSNCSDNAVIIESLLQLISPFQWTFVNISYLTAMMIDYIDAPIPYIVGVPRDVWKQVKKQKEKTLPPDVAIYDIDKKKLKYDETLPNMPEDTMKNVYDTMLNILKNRSSSTISTEEYWVGCTLKLKIAFFQLYLSLIGNYLGFYKADETEEPPSVSNIFHLNLYLDSLKGSSKEFMKEMVKTQQFTTFIERSYLALRNNNELSYFIRGVRKLQSGGKGKLVEDLRKIYSRLLFNYRNVCLKPALYHLEECFELYLAMVRKKDSNASAKRSAAVSLLEEQGGEDKKTSEGKQKIIDLNKIVDLRRVTRYKPNGKPGTDFIFRKKEDSSPVKSPISLKAPTKDAGESSGEDIGVAEEFTNNEDRIETDFKRRSTLKPGKTFFSPAYYNSNSAARPQPMVTPFGNSERPRSISTYVSPSTSIFQLRKQQERYLRVTPFESKQLKTSGSPPQCKGDFVESAIKASIEDTSGDITEVNGGVKEGSIGRIQSLNINNGMSEPGKFGLPHPGTSPIKSTTSPIFDKALTLSANKRPMTPFTTSKDRTCQSPVSHDSYDFDTITAIVQRKSATLSGIALTNLFGRSKHLPIISDTDETTDPNASPIKKRLDI